MAKKTTSEIDNYLETFVPAIRSRLKKMRLTIRKAAPKAVESFSYQMPTFKGVKNLVHFAGIKNHVGFYPGSEAIAHFKSQLRDYKHAKGSVQFPHDQPLPLALVTRIVRYRVQQDRKIK